MLNEVTAGISAKLSEVFGDGYEIYTEEGKQNMQLPYFLVKPLTSSQTPAAGKRSLRNYSFEIRYVPKSENAAAEEMNSIEDRLFEALEYVAAGADSIRGARLGSERVDGVLHFSVSYSFYVKQQAEAESFMQEVSLESGVKE